MGITTTLDELSQLLDSYHYSDRASWLRNKRDEYLSAETEREKKAIVSQIKNVMAGMGSLSDLYITPPEGSLLSESEVNRKLYRLFVALDGEISAELA